MSFTASLDRIVSQNLSGLLAVHPSWERARLGTIARILNGFAFPSGQFSRSEGKPLLRIRDVSRGWTETFFAGPYDPAYLVRPGDLVVGMDGDFNCALWRGPEALLNQRVCRLLCDDRYYVLRFLEHVLPGYLTAINAHTSSMTVKHLSSATVAAIPLPLPPLSEQHRIVAKLEELFTQLDAGVEALKRAQVLLKRYKQSVLTAAVEGDLTRKWREAHKDKLEPASVLVERILKERRKKWQSEHPGKKYKEPVKPETEGLPELPDGWCWSTIEQFAAGRDHAIKRGPFGSAIKKTFFVPSGYKVYEQQHVIKKDFSLGTYYIDAERYAELGAFAVKPGDILISCSGTIGEIVIVPEGVEEGVINQALLKLTLDDGLLHKSFFLLAFRAKREQILLDSTRGSAMKNISSVKDLKGIAFPLPPFQEQVAIVDEMKRLGSLVEEAQETVQSELKRADRLRQAILERAFTGRLVPQNPNDEPASVLLERIKHAKAIAASPGSRPRTRAKRGSITTQKRLIEDGE